MANSHLLNGKGARKVPSWIDGFIKSTDNLDAPEIFRKWAAISTVGSVLEQKVWLMTSSPIFPNLYVFIVGHPASGKNRTIRAAKAYLRDLKEFKIAPISLTWASLIDALVRAKRFIARIPDEPLEYNSMMIAPEEMGAFIHKYDKEMTDGLSALYDNDLYDQERRGGEIRIKMKSPLVSIITGCTPSNLMDFMPDSAWGQGFTSRIIMVFSDERIVGDDFAKKASGPEADLIHDLTIINGLIGEFQVTEEYRNVVNNWRQLDESLPDWPKPSHPKLIHYNGRRRVNIYKLSMISAIDRSNTLLLTKDDFNRAMSWLLEAETFMPDIFKAGVSGGDSKAMDEIYHFVLSAPSGVRESKLVNFARERVPAHSVIRVIEVMERSGLIKAISYDAKTGSRMWKATAEV